MVKENPQIQERLQEEVEEVRGRRRLSVLKGQLRFLRRQCQHGLVDINHLPIKKHTRIDCNFEMPMVSIECQGHFDHQGNEILHSPLEGKDTATTCLQSKTTSFSLLSQLTF